MKDSGIKNLEVMMESLERIYSAGQKQVGKISTVGFLKKAYGLKKSAEKKRKSEDPMLSVRGGAVSGLKTFVKNCKKAEGETMNKSQSTPPPMPFYEEPRRTQRVSIPTHPMEMTLADFTGLPPKGANAWTNESICSIMDDLKNRGQDHKPFVQKIIKRGKSPFKHGTSMAKMYRVWKNVAYSRMILDDFTGLPPQGAKVWTKETIALIMDDLRNSGQDQKPFLLKIIERGKSPYKHHTSMAKMYRIWKKEGDIRMVGRQPIMYVNEVQTASKKNIVEEVAR